MAEPFHEGELAIQELVGVREEASRVAGMIDSVIPVRALSFLEAQQMLVLATIDAEGRPRVSLLSGAKGFARSRDGSRLDVALRGTANDDPLWRNIAESPQVGLLAIDVTTRKRLRMNGSATIAGRHTLSVAIAEAYPNCPKYIQRRDIVVAPELPMRTEVTGEALGSEQVALIASADTLFVASAHPTRGADASHRGGNPGFVRVIDATTIRIPDYVGNTMFNTLGNLAVSPRATVVVMNFAERRMLELIGDTTTHFEQPSKRAHTGLSWDLRINRFREHDFPSTLAFAACEASPFNPAS